MPVKARNRVRHLMTIAGELRLSRNCHYCKKCQFGFYPRDIELKLPEEGEVSDAMEKRVLDIAALGHSLPVSHLSQPVSARRRSRRPTPGSNFGRAAASN